MVKKELKYYPILGWYMLLSRVVFVDRHNRKSAIQTFSEVADHIKKVCPPPLTRATSQTGTSIFMFPEGTRSRQLDNSLLPFKKGAFYLATSGEIPIVPIVISTYGDIYSTRRMRFEGGTIRVRGIHLFVFSLTVRYRSAGSDPHDQGYRH